MRNSVRFSFLAILAVANFAFAQSSNLELDAVLIESSDLMQTGDSEAALALLKRYEADFSSRPEFLNNLAVAYLGTADPISAVTILRQLVDSDPVFSIVAHNLIELEMQSTDARPETINPVLFVQSTQSFFASEMENIEAINIAEDSVSSRVEVITPHFNETPTSTHLEIVETTIQDITEDWADAWSAKNLESYLGFYTSDYHPDDITSNREWRIGRSAALNKPGEIQVGTSELEIEIDGNSASVVFEQYYSSNNYSDRVEKTLVYSYLDGGWKIISETSTPIE